MKKRYNLVDLDCANCAAKMEEAIKKIDGVNTAIVSFLTQKMTVDADDARFEEIMDEVVAVCKKVEDVYKSQGVGHLAAGSPEAPDGGDVDDAAPLFMEHGGQHRLDSVPGALEVHAEVAVPEGVVHVLEEGLPGDAGVVDENADLPQLLSLIHI